MIRFLRYIAYSTTLVFMYIVGVYSSKLLQIPTQPTNFADTTSAVAAIVGILVAIATITNWKKSKIQEDSYQIIKSYVSELLLIDTTVTEILIENGSICPLPGNIVPTQAFVTETFQNIDTLLKNLSKQHRQIHRTKSELAFWGGKLTPIHELHHTSLMEELQSFQTVANCLRNNLQYYFKHDSSSINQVTQEYEKLETFYRAINTTLSGRKNMKMSDMFTIKT